MRSPIVVAFSRRLNALCNEAGIPKDGRHRAIGKMFGSKPAVAQKWIDGKALPASYEKLAAIAARFNVEFEWLATGRGQRRPSITTH